ncbi:hypothetical protein [Shewanella mangrovisoli]|uniref:hypothetical protein n=1 Tax=Shewanella mangrovisoli TaxID=2864211 RepID=UPI0035B75987
MGLPVTVYRHTDAGAPQLSPLAPSAIIEILKKCLVEGYGTKAPLGWSLEYEDAGNYAVAFRNSTVNGGSGGFVKVYSATGSNATSTDFRIKTAKNMTDINTFIDATGYSTFDLSNGQQNGWQVIGTSRGFWLIIEHANRSDYDFTSDSYQGFQLTAWVGDIESDDPNDAGRFIQLVGHTTPTSDSTAVTAVNRIGGRNNPLAYAAMYSCDGSTSGMSTYLVAQPFTTGGAADTTNDSTTMGVVETLLPAILYTTSATIFSAAFPPSRGAVPGLFQSSFLGYSGSTRPLDKSFDGKLFTKLSSNYIRNYWINLEEWYAG